MSSKVLSFDNVGLAHQLLEEVALLVKITSAIK